VSLAWLGLDMRTVQGRKAIGARDAGAVAAL